MPDDIQFKRNEIKKAYSSESWSYKVDRMSDQQVIAIYFRFKNQGKI